MWFLSSEVKFLLYNNLLVELKISSRINTGIYLWPAFVLTLKHNFDRVHHYQQPRHQRPPKVANELLYHFAVAK